jgi:hypothetical protein
MACALLLGNSMLKIALALSLVSVAFACSLSGHSQSSSRATSSSIALVTVPAEGRSFDPPIDPDQLPAGVWYCDMGKVHWAQPKEGDRQCPICKMELKQRKAHANP